MLTTEEVMGNRVTALIPARAGSRGIPRKNVRLLAGKPLVAWTIEASLSSDAVDCTYISTNDPEVAVIAADYGCEVLRRPNEISDDTASADDVIRHFLDETNASGSLVYLQPTSPMRSGNDIDSAIKLLASGRSQAVFSVCVAAEKPEWMYRMRQDLLLDPILADSSRSRRQDLAKAYLLNGAIYAFRLPSYHRVGKLRELQALGYEMPSERSIDIDGEREWRMAERLLTCS